MTSRRDLAARSARLAPVRQKWQKVAFVVAAAAWGVVTLGFWGWWLDPAHVANPVLFTLLSFCLGWATLVPLYFVIHYAIAVRPVGNIAHLPKLRVAMVVTKAPSEPFHVVRKTLEGMLAQTHPHATWLADEQPTAETLAWCAAHGVSVSTRYGVAEYHQKTWPRRTRCKEGNLAYFYDHYGYERYDVVVQLDADHVPGPGYLEAMVLPFADPDVGYVSAPSICDANAAESWSARGRLYAEGNLHGALQAGYTAIGGPLCFGSHYAVRTYALMEIGGLGPELAEDHSTSMMMCSHGWRGVHAIDAIAHGDGPRTFADLITQEFQWSRSVTRILLEHSPRHLGRIPARLRVQFIFSQLWYPLFSLFMALGVLLPIIGVIFRTPFANVSFPEFVPHALPMSLALMGNSLLWRAEGMYRPFDAKLVSWETMAFQFARWPWSLWGCICAVREHLSHTHVDFRVTPKGASEADPVPLVVMAPYGAIALVSALPSLLVNDAAAAAGFHLFALANAVVYAGLILLIIWRHRIENRVKRAPVRQRVAVAGLATLVLIVPASALSMRTLESVFVLEQGAPVSIVRPSFSPAGAGQQSRVTLQLALTWRQS